MKEIFEKMSGVLSAAKSDAEKLEAGNQAAGTRLRLAMQDIKVLAQSVRTKVQDLREIDKKAKAEAKAAKEAEKAAKG